MKKGRKLLSAVQSGKLEVIPILFITWLIILSLFFFTNPTFHTPFHILSLPHFSFLPTSVSSLIKSPFDMNYGYWSVTTAFISCFLFEKWSVSQRNHCLHLLLQVHWHQRQFPMNQSPPRSDPLLPFLAILLFQLVTTLLPWSCGTRMTWVVHRSLLWIQGPNRFCH